MHVLLLCCSNRGIRCSHQAQVSDHVDAGRIKITNLPTLCTSQSGNIPQNQQLIYADLGPSSLKQSAISLSLLDDDRIEYARLNYNARQEHSIMQTKSTSDEHPAGMP